MLAAFAADQQVVAATAATLTFIGRDSDGEPSDPGTVTVTVSPSDPSASAIVTDGATTEDGNVRSYTLTASQTASVDRLTAVWSSSGVVLATTYIDVVGAPLVTLADFRANEETSAAEKADFLRFRREVDDFIRARCGRSFVPRFDVEHITNRHSTYRMPLRFPNLRSISWAVDEDGTAIDVASQLVPSDDGIAVLDDTYWPYGRVTVGYVHGMDRPPRDIVGAASLLIDRRKLDGASLMPAGVSNVTNPLGSTSFTPIAGFGRSLTAVPEIDEALNAWAWKVPGIA